MRKMPREDLAQQAVLTERVAPGQCMDGKYGSIPELVADTGSDDLLAKFAHEDAEAWRQIQMQRDSQYAHYLHARYLEEQRNLKFVEQLVACENAFRVLTKHMVDTQVADDAKYAQTLVGKP